MNKKNRTIGKTSYPLRRIFSKICCNLSQSKWISSGIRIRLLRLAGIKIGKNCFIGSSVVFDGIMPQLIHIGNHVKITSGTKILTHFFNPTDQGMYAGEVVIGDEVFIGLNTLVVNSICIGEGAVVGAGSVVIRDIPAWEIWAGNPARYIKDRIH